MLAVRLPNDIEERLDELSKRTGRSKSFYARAALTSYLEDLEDIYLGESRLEDLASGKATSHPLSDLIAEYDL